MGGGYTLVELDFLLTADQQVVCSHDFKNIGYSLSQRPTLAEFEKAVILTQHGQCHGITLAWLVNQLKLNPQIKVVFDTNEKELYPLLKTMLDYCDTVDFDLRAQLIVQIYGYQHYQQLQTLNFAEYWLSNFKAGYSVRQINRLFTDCQDVTTIVMPYAMWRFYDSLGLKFTNKQMAVHTLPRTATNRIATAARHGVSYVYVD